MGTINPIKFFFRLFHQGDSIRGTTLPVATGAAGSGGSNGASGSNGGSSGSVKARKSGFRLARTLLLVLPLAITAGFFHWLFAWMQVSEHYSLPDVPNFLLWDVTVPGGAKNNFYRGIFAKATSASDISPIQLLLMAILLFALIRLLLVMAADWSVNRKMRPHSKIANYASLCVFLLPALGFLSTIVGILAADEAIPRSTIKLIIFGPSGLGMLGYILASGVNHLALWGED